MRDRLGNEVKPKDLLFWAATGLVVEVVEAIDDDSPKIEVPNAPKRPANGKIVVKIAMPVPRQGIAAGEELLLQDFIRVVNPKNQELLDRLAERGAMPPRTQ